ncbi:MAG: alanine--tRNA ligase [Vicinamibacteria bacterium]|nr:alanine--tRNA ligase [Vicinamibacteria bacterium]
MKTADQIRHAFLRYFEERGHRVVKSSSLVPESDPTLLFANAGMNQFKDLFLGREKRDYARAASSQKCVRAGGKHNDLENVGQTARHHTFFEMLGNFSFGDYFKKDAIAFGWEFLTRDLGLDPSRMKVTIFRGEDGVPRDSEAHGFWLEHVAADRILELSAKDNFWAMGDTGPCGPCSEIHFHQGDDLPCADEAAGGKCKGVECECDRWLEIWNLVFMQFDRDSAGKLTPLPAPCVDTGMGLERVSAVAQGHRSNYDTDLFTPLFAAISKLCGKPYGATTSADDMSMRVIADHMRATTFLVGDGVIPGNEGRGYVLRKIMRRALRHGRRLGIEGAVLVPLIDAVVERMAGAYPELHNQKDSIRKIVEVEEDRFSTTLRQAFVMFDQAAAKLKAGDVLPGAEAFRLYDTYGLALDFTEELAKDRGLTVDNAGFDRELQAQQERARSASKLGAVTGDPVYMELLHKQKPQFVGYDTLALDEARVLAVVRGGASVSRLDVGEEGEIILDRTPFYGESGGQVGDRGVIAAEGAAADVTDCRLPVPGLYSHHVKVTAGGFEPGMVVRCEVDPAHRAGAMRHHSATHLLHAALREILGPHVKQAGSMVAPDRLRFDFSHYAGVTPRELRHLENRVNGEILRNTGLETKVMGREEALSYGALAFFGDKYGERVRVVEVPGFSKEFCGGTHVHRTGDIGLFLFSFEQGISAGTRRVEALAGDAAMARAQADQGILEELEQAAKTDRRALVDEYAKLRDQLKTREREVQALKMKLATGGGGASDDEKAEHAGVRLLTPRYDGLDKKSHAAVVDDLRNRHKAAPFLIVSAAVAEDGVHVIAAVSESLQGRVKAPELMKRLGLRGGGRPDFAQGGGVAADDVDAMRKKAGELMREMLEGVGAA